MRGFRWSAPRSRSCAPPMHRPMLTPRRRPPPVPAVPCRAVPCAPPLHRAKGAGSLPPSLGAAACHGPRATGAAAPTHRQPARTSRHTHPSDHMACAVARTWLPLHIAHVHAHVHVPNRLLASYHL